MCNIIYNIIYHKSTDGNVIRGDQKTILKVTSPGADDNIIWDQNDYNDFDTKYS